MGPTWKPEGSRPRTHWGQDIAELQFVTLRVKHIRAWWRMDRSLHPETLSQQSLPVGISCLSRIDPELCRVIIQLGNPPLWSREPGFPTMIHIILEQQVSLASAEAAFARLEAAAGELTPERFLSLTDAELREIGFSRQKTGYGRELSRAILSGELDLAGLQSLDDATVRSKLMAIRGIGPWTADIYLLMALLRPDVWPSGDLALAKAVQKINGLAERPEPDALDAMARRWTPWRAVAARILWHYYLNQ
jgi:DNA-3-methyladenine glycosylase II